MGNPASDEDEASAAPEGGVPDGPAAEELRRRVEEAYDFEDFGPADMAQMSLEEWDAAFDPDTWITGAELLDRVERDLRSRIASREVFARVERVADDEGERLLAYSDQGYAVVFPDGSVEGRGTVRRDVEPTVALCSMEDYEPPEPPTDADLPSPEAVTAGTGDLGNRMLQLIAGAQILVGLGLVVAWLVTDLGTIVAPAAGIGFVLVGVFLFMVVANARLSDRYRAEEYRERLRRVGVDDEPPEHVRELRQQNDIVAGTDTDIDAGPDTDIDAGTDEA